MNKLISCEIIFNSIKFAKIINISRKEANHFYLEKIMPLKFKGSAKIMS